MKHFVLEENESISFDKVTETEVVVVESIGELGKSVRIKDAIFKSGLVVYQQKEIHISNSMLEVEKLKFFDAEKVVIKNSIIRSRNLAIRSRILAFSSVKEVVIQDSILEVDKVDVSSSDVQILSSSIDAREMNISSSRVCLIFNRTLKIEKLCLLGSVVIDVSNTSAQIDTIELYKNWKGNVSEYYTDRYVEKIEKYY